MSECYLIRDCKHNIALKSQNFGEVSMVLIGPKMILG
jgi:hypothetical protein